MKLGLLVEAAERHQKLAEAAIAKLDKQTQGLRSAVADEVRQAVGEQMKFVQADAQRAVEALQKVKRGVNARVALSTLGATAISAGITLIVAWWVLPTRGEITALRAERDELASNVAVLNQRGARADLRRCGTGHLCVRVDLKAPRYGEASDYLIVKGY